MRQVLGCVLVLAAALPLAADDTDDVKKELKALEGKWKAVGFEVAGSPLAREGVPEFLFTVGAGGKSTAKTLKNEDQATITVDPKKSPKTIDNLHESGASKGKKQYGIYKLDGDKWTVCMTLPGAAESDRPKDFNTKGTTNVVFVFERVKDEKKP